MLCVLFIRSRGEHMAFYQTKADLSSTFFKKILFGHLHRKTQDGGAGFLLLYADSVQIIYGRTGAEAAGASRE